MNKLGFYVQTPTVDGLFDAMRVVRPPVMLVHAVNRGWLEDTHRFSPDTFIVGRLFQDGGQQERWLSVPDPDHPDQKRWLDAAAAAEQGRRFAEQVLALDHPLALATWPPGGSLDDPNTRLLVDAWMTLNEFVQGPASDDFKRDPATIRAKAAAFDAFQVAFRARLKEAHPRLEAVAFNFGAGNFPDAKGYLEWFPGTLKSYVYLGFHEYGWPTLFPDPGSATAAGDHQKAMTGIRAKHGARHRAIITEAGLARMQQKKDAGDVGWLFEGDTIAEEDYWQSLDWYNDRLCEQDYVLGACLFSVGFEGTWRTFRHTGPDTQGRPIRIMDRLRALREQPAVGAGAAGDALPLDLPAPPPAQPMVAMQGRVICNGQVVPEAQVRLLAPDDKLGGDPRAAVYDAAALSWTRILTDFDGSAWNCWQRFVADHVAGITWEEFETQVLRYNPSLWDSGGRFVTGRTYLLPEPRRYDHAYGIEQRAVWDRPIMGFAGDRWDCWQQYVRGKVSGLSWDTFKIQVGERNPHLAADGYRFDPEKSYLLPREPQQDLYTRVTRARRGRPYSFSGLLPGCYQVEVSAPGYESLRTEIEIDSDLDLDLEIALAEVATPAGAPFVTIQGTEFVAKSRPFRFIGVNLRGLAYYGDSDKYPNASQSDQLQAARAMGARVARIFLPYKKAPTAEVISRLARLLGRMANEAADMYLLVALTDLYQNSEHHVQGDDDFYQPQGDGFTLLGRDFFEGGYRQNYLPYVEAVVKRFKSEPQILAWEIGNELKLPQTFETRQIFIDFNLAVAKRIRELDANHCIGTGMLSTRHAGLQAFGQKRLYGSPLIGFVTSHIYDADYADDDSQLANHLVKPFLVEEAGFKAPGGENRGESIRKDMDVLFGVDARGYMQWGFMAGDRNNGDGDAGPGMDRLLHSDWDTLFNLYKERAGQL